MNMTSLICFPFAGGSSIVYNSWKKYIHPTIRLESVELAGRGKRFNELCNQDFLSAFNDIYRNLNKEIMQSDYSIFGHSMGTLFALELAHRAIEDGYKSPRHVFVSGRYPPQLEKEKKVVHQLSDAEFKYEIMKLGGTHEELFQNLELFNTFAPVIKADYSVVDSYRFNENRPVLNCDFTVLWGQKDQGVDSDEMRMWNFHTSGTCSFLEFAGGHFYINDETEKLVAVINKALIRAY